MFAAARAVFGRTEVQVAAVRVIVEWPSWSCPVFRSVPHAETGQGCGAVPQPVQRHRRYIEPLPIVPSLEVPIPANSFGTLQACSATTCAMAS